LYRNWKEKAINKLTGQKKKKVNVQKQLSQFFMSLR
jgi:hypothetical protein